MISFPITSKDWPRKTLRCSSNPVIRPWALRKKGGVYSADVGRSYRAIARERRGDYYWFWIGTHEEYNNFKFSDF